MPRLILRWARRLLAAALKLAVILGISFLGLELLLLVFNDLVFRGAPNMYDPDLGYKTRPGIDWFGHPTNRFGFNDRDYPLERAPGTYRVLLVGDSFNWAGGYEGNYVEQVEARLAVTLGPGRVEVINVGYPGQDTALELATLAKYGLQYQPDLVVLGFFAGNDLYDALPWWRRIAVGSALVDLDLRQGRERTLFGQPLVARSRLWLFVETKRRELGWISARERAAEAGATTPVAVAGAGRGGGAAGGAEAGPPAAYVLTPQYRAIMRDRMRIVDPAWEAERTLRGDYALGQLDAMRLALAERGIDFTVVVYPDEFQVDEALRRSLADREHLDLSGYDWELPQDLVMGWCGAHGVACHDLLPPFQAAHDAGRRLYLENDSHWNPAGNALAAERIAGWLEVKARAFFEERGDG